MLDEELAKEIVKRLNALIQHRDVRMDVAELIEMRILATVTTAEHSTIQVVEEGADLDSKVGFLGLLNGIVGTRPQGKGGYISAYFDDSGNLTEFRLTSTHSMPKFA